MNAEESIREGKLKAALSELQDAVRTDPSRPEYRTFLFQLLCVLGDWNRALTQLNVVADMDGTALLMAQTYRELLLCEAFRAEVFEGKREPLLFGKPAPWLCTLVQAPGQIGSGQVAVAKNTVLEALDQAPARSGTIDDQPFEWLSDADMRLGPAFELVINGKYYWVPMHCVAEISFTDPVDLRDLVWLPVQIKWLNEGDSIGFMPVRYPGEATLDDPMAAMARKTLWTDIGDEFFVGTGQRMFTTAAGEYSLLQTRKIIFDSEVG